MLRDDAGGKQLKELLNSNHERIFAGPAKDDNMLEWEVTLIGPEKTLYADGVFRAQLSFPAEYPLLPPKMRFITKMCHPNIYEDGTVCISILHPPGDDPNQYESAGERWTPVQTVETILLSVLSLLSEPNWESPANVDAAALRNKDLAEYKKTVRALVRASQEMSD